MTDPAHAVALQFDDGPTIVVSPDRPNLFTEELREKTGVEAVVEPAPEG